MTKNPPNSADPVKRPVRRRVRPVTPAPPAAPVPNNPPDAQPDEQSEKVGYGKPPRHSQFKPGFDPRRPRGRKAGSTNKANSIVAMMESPTTLRTPDGGVRSVSTADAMARKLREQALSGELPAIVKAFDLYFKMQPPLRPAVQNEPTTSDTPEELSATDQAILAWHEEEIRARLAKGPTP